MAARNTPGKVQLLTRSELDRTAKYPATATDLTKLPVQSAYLDGELCAVRPNGVSDFALMQQASDRDGAGLVYFLFDLLELNGEPLAAMPLAERKSRLAAQLGSPPPGIDFSPHEARDGEAFRRAACRHGLEGVVSKRLDRPYLPGAAAPGSKRNLITRLRQLRKRRPLPWGARWVALARRVRMSRVRRSRPLHRKARRAASVPVQRLPQADLGQGRNYLRLQQAAAAHLVQSDLSRHAIEEGDFQHRTRAGGSASLRRRRG